MGGKEDIPVKFVLDPEAEEVSIGGAGVVELVGKEMDRKAGRESQPPNLPDPEEGDQPEDQGQFIRMKEEKVLLVFVKVGGLKELFYAYPPEAKKVKVLEEMIQVDEDSGEEESARGGEGAGEEVDQPRTENRNKAVLVKLQGKIKEFRVFWEDGVLSLICPRSRQTPRRRWNPSLFPAAAGVR